MLGLEQFGKYLISEGEDLAPIVLDRIEDEVVCLGFNPDTDGLVEIHVVADAEDYSASDTLSFIDRAWKTATLSGPCFPKMIDVDEFDGLAFYVTEVNAGERLEDYLARLGPMEPALAMAQVMELTDAIVRLQAHYPLLVGLRLSNLLVVLHGGAYLTLRITDLGLARLDPGQGRHFSLRDALMELSALLVFLLTGRDYQPDRGMIESIRGLPSDLKFLLRHSLNPDSGAMPRTLEEYRKALRICLSRVSKNISFSSNYRPLEVVRKRHPVSEIHRRLLTRTGIGEELGPYYRILPDSESNRRPFSIPVLDTRRNRKINLALLPSGSILPLSHGGQVAAEMALIPPRGHVPLLRSYRYWDSDGVAFIAEETITGFSLPEVLVKRGQCLEPEESMVLLRALSEAFDCAAGLELPVRNLSLHSVLFHFPDESPFRVSDLMLRHIDHWPAFVLKLRCHASVEGVLTAPPSGSLETCRYHRQSPTPESVIAKSFVGIAEHVTIGPWPAPGPTSETAEDERVAELREFFRSWYAAIDHGAAFERAKFLDDLEPLLPHRDREMLDGIVDGHVAVAAAAAKAPVVRSGSRRWTNLPPVRSSGPPPAPGEDRGEVVSLGLISDEEYAGGGAYHPPHLN